MADVISPLPGIFYRRPAPDKEPYVNEGDHVDKDQVVGIIEIMKQFNEIRSTASGTVAAFAIEDGGTVNPGDVLVSVTEA